MAENTEQRVTIEETKREEGTQIPAVEVPVVEIPTLEPVVESVPVLVIPPPATSLKSFLAKALEKIQFRKRAKLEKIVKLALEKGSVNNDRVEKLLHISDSTAQRYLNVLVRDGRLQVVGLGNLRRYEPLGGSNGGN